MYSLLKVEKKTDLQKVSVLNETSTVEKVSGVFEVMSFQSQLSAVHFNSLNLSRSYDFPICIIVVYKITTLFFHKHVTC